MSQSSFSDAKYTGTTILNLPHLLEANGSDFP
jgi:hypothetical protein